jgi:hypothetical protein
MYLFLVPEYGKTDPAFRDSRGAFYTTGLCDWVVTVIAPLSKTGDGVSRAGQSKKPETTINGNLRGISRKIRGVVWRIWRRSDCLLGVSGLGP